eukprot:Rmarinus@m.21107
MLVFVTVGTTQFDDLIRTIDTLEFAELMRKRGYDAIRIQIGRGVYEPTRVLMNPSAMTATGAMECDFYRFKPSLDKDIRQADLVISHAGAGSIMEVLRFGKPLVVVVNDALMGNHQRELADELATRRCLYRAKCSSLLEVLRCADFPSLQPLPPSDASAFMSVLDEEVGFSDPAQAKSSRRVIASTCF